MARALTYSFGLALLCGACGASSDEGLDPVATYEAFGYPFEPAGALPIQAVFAEPDSFLDRAVMVEGMATNCRDEDCWMKMQAGDDAVIRILPQDFSAPDTVGERRIVVHGRLTAADTSSYHLHATGLMIEKVRP